MLKPNKIHDRNEIDELVEKLEDRKRNVGIPPKTYKSEIENLIGQVKEEFRKRPYTEGDFCRCLPQEIETKINKQLGKHGFWIDCEEFWCWVNRTNLKYPAINYKILGKDFTNNHTLTIDIKINTSFTDSEIFGPDRYLEEYESLGEKYNLKLKRKRGVYAGMFGKSPTEYYFQIKRGLLFHPTIAHFINPHSVLISAEYNDKNIASLLQGIVKIFERHHHYKEYK